MIADKLVTTNNQTIFVMFNWDWVNKDDNFK